MNAARLIDQLNRIASFYEAMPDAVQSSLDVATHVKKFWDPRMRVDLYAHLDAAGDGALRPLAARAMREHRALLMQPASSQ